MDIYRPAQPLTLFEVLKLHVLSLHLNGSKEVAGLQIRDMDVCVCLTHPPGVSCTPKFGDYHSAGPRPSLQPSLHTHRQGTMVGDPIVPTKEPCAHLGSPDMLVDDGLRDPRILLQFTLQDPGQSRCPNKAWPILQICPCTQHPQMSPHLCVAGGGGHGTHPPTPWLQAWLLRVGIGSKTCPPPLGLGPLSLTHSYALLKPPS